MYQKRAPPEYLSYEKDHITHGAVRFAARVDAGLQSKHAHRLKGDTVQL